MTEPYDKQLRNLILKIAKNNNIRAAEGVYSLLGGPQYETPAEVKMLRLLGANTVGMSTIPEVIALRQLNVKVACISTVTNYGTGVKKNALLSHEEVKQIGLQVSSNIDKILNELFNFFD